eukprot:1422732-Amphidinium_carterae.1
MLALLFDDELWLSEELAGLDAEGDTLGIQKLEDWDTVSLPTIACRRTCAALLRIAGRRNCPVLTRKTGGGEHAGLDQELLDPTSPL